MDGFFPQIHSILIKLRVITYFSLSKDLHSSVLYTYFSLFSRDLYWCARRSNWGDLLPAVPAPETTPDSDPNEPTQTTKVLEKESERDDINYMESAGDDLSRDPAAGYESDSGYTAEQLDTLNEQAILMSQNNAHLNDCDFSQTSSSELQGLTSH